MHKTQITFTHITTHFLHFSKEMTTLSAWWDNSEHSCFLLAYGASLAQQVLVIPKASEP